MKPKNDQYAAYKTAPEWKVLDNAIQQLVTNQDIVEQTDRAYIVGFLVAALAERKIEN